MQNLSPASATDESQSWHFSCSATVLQNSATSGQFQWCRIVVERLQNNSAGFTAETHNTCRICRINSANFIVLRSYVTRFCKILQRHSACVIVRFAAQFCCQMNENSRDFHHRAFLSSPQMSTKSTWRFQLKLCEPFEIVTEKLINIVEDAENVANEKFSFRQIECFI